LQDYGQFGSVLASIWCNSAVAAGINEGLVHERGCTSKHRAAAGQFVEVDMHDSLKQQANAHFSTEKVKTILSESETNAAAVAVKTARLKGLRLARDAAEQSAPREVVSVRNTSRKKKPLVPLRQD
jgi:hypothetical protein